MKRLLLSLAAVAMLPACGLYTNVPAQIQVLSIKPASVAYQKPDADGFSEMKVEPGEVTLRAEPGSIGAYFDTMSVHYYKPVLPAAEVEPTFITPLLISQTLRVDSSNYPADPGGQPLEVGNTGSTVYVGTATTTLPIVTRHVMDYGNKAGINASTITAEVTWSGDDDAGFPIQVRFHVPITFTGTPTKS